MSATYDTKSILNIMEAKRDGPVKASTANALTTRLLKRSRIASITLKRHLCSLAFQVADPYDFLYEGYWQMVFEE